jgi:hypothetical protein
MTGFSASFFDPQQDGGHFLFEEILRTVERCGHAGKTVALLPAFVHQAGDGPDQSAAFGLRKPG